MKGCIGGRVKTSLWGGGENALGTVQLQTVDVGQAVLKVPYALKQALLLEGIHKTHSVVTEKSVLHVRNNYLGKTCAVLHIFARSRRCREMCAESST